MKKIKKDDLYKNLGQFLQEKGIELKDGTYAARIRQGCAILTETINFTQDHLAKARNEMDAKLAHLRQLIHEKTAPKNATAAPKPPPVNKTAKPKPAAKKTPPKKAAKTQPEKGAAPKA